MYAKGLWVSGLLLMLAGLCISVALVVSEVKPPKWDAHTGFYIGGGNRGSDDDGRGEMLLTGSTKVILVELGWKGIRRKGMLA
jgi:hypothetical protein